MAQIGLEESKAVNEFSEYKPKVKKKGFGTGQILSNLVVAYFEKQ